MGGCGCDVDENRWEVVWMKGGLLGGGMRSRSCGDGKRGWRGGFMGCLVRLQGYWREWGVWRENWIGEMMGFGVVVKVRCKESMKVSDSSGVLDPSIDRKLTVFTNSVLIWYF